MINPTVVITGDDTHLRKTLAGSSRALAAFGADAAQAFTGISAGVLTIAALGTALAASTRNAINQADAMAKLSSRTGIAAESLAAYRLGAQLSDVSSGELQVGLRKLAVNMDAAAHGNDEAATAFRRLGVSVTDSNGSLRKTEDVLGDVADVIAKLPEGPERAALAVAVFGRAGEKLIPFLEGGRAGLEGFRKEAERFGLALSSDVLKSAEAFNDDLTRLGAVSSGIGAQIATGMLPALNSVVGALASSAKAGEEWQRVGEGMGNAIRFVAGALVAARSAFVNFANEIGGRAAQIAAVLSGNFSQVAAIAKEVEADQDRLIQSGLDQLAALTNETAKEGAKRAEVTRKTGAEVVAARKSEADRVLAVLSAQVAAEKQAARDIEEARRNLAKVEADNKRFLAEIAAGPQKQAEDLQGTDVQGQLVKAREAFKKGDLEAAAALTAKVKESLLALSRAGKESGAVLSFLGKQAAELDRSIAQQKFDDFVTEIGKLKGVIDDTLGKAIALGFDIPKSRENLEQVLAELRKQAAAGLTIPVASVANTSLTDEERARVLAGQALAGGGLLRGPGTGTSDSILARVSAGEYVVRAAAVQRYGVSMMEAINGMLLPRFAVGGAVAAGGRLSERGGPTHTLNFNLGDSGSFSLRASQAEADSVTAVFERLALQRGRRR